MSSGSVKADLSAKFLPGWTKLQFNHLGTTCEQLCADWSDQFTLGQQVTREEKAAESASPNT